MNKEMLSERKAAIEKQFSEFSQKKIELEDEMKRLQGEHRVITELLNADVEEPKRLRKAKVENATD